jgi:hypothetical protein
MPKVVFFALAMAALPALAQSGLRPPERGEVGLDPSFARGWLSPEYDRFGFAASQWRDGVGFAPSPRMRWSYDFGDRASFSMSLANSRESELETRPLALYGRYWFTPNWAFAAESMSRDAGGLLRMQDFRIGVQRRF